LSKPAIPALLLLLLTGCNQASAPTDVSEPSPGALSGELAPSRDLRQARRTTQGPAGRTIPQGFNPLPTPQQVVAALRIGRFDPFAPVSPPAGTAPQSTGLPQGFRFSGVVRGGGQAEALVQFGSLSGTLRAGQVGGRSTDLLPLGWTVARVDGQRGRLTLRQGGQLVTADL
jgi:hypothetical protein